MALPDRRAPPAYDRVVSVSLYNGGLVGAVDGERRPRVVDDGNWSLQGSSEGPEYRALALYVQGRDGPVFGYRPPAQREPFQQSLQHPGVFTRPELLGWRGDPLEPGAVCELIVTGGNRYVGWGDTAGEDWMEWGSRDPRDASVTVVATSGPLAVPRISGPLPPPPPDDDVPQDRRLELDPRLPEIGDNALAELRLAKASYEQWRAANPAEAKQVIAYLAALANGESPAPPALSTRKGRGIVAMLQAAAASIGRLP
jgi:hypothetical protein